MSTSLKSVTAQQLLEAYIQLNPQENLKVTEDSIRIFNNWLTRYHATPEKAIATQNWYGKVTTALFKALGVKQPRTKKDMLVALSA